MFAKLGDFLTEHNVRRPMRYVSASGDEFVVLPAKEYSLLTGIDIEALPTMESFDIVSNVPEEVEEIKENRGELVPASTLATISLEEEFGVDRLPL